MWKGWQPVASQYNCIQQGYIVKRMSIYTSDLLIVQKYFSHICHVVKCLSLHLCHLVVA